MVYATQGAVTNNVSNGIRQGSVATHGRAAPVSGGYFNVGAIKKQFNEKLDDELEELKNKVDDAKNTDLKGLYDEYDATLDSILGNGKREARYNAEYNYRRTPIENWLIKNQTYKIHKEKYGYSVTYTTPKWVYDSYFNQLNNLSATINKELDDYQNRINKAKSMKDTLATDKDINDSDLLKFQNMLIGAKNDLINQYDSYYSEQANNVRNNYNNSFNDYMKTFGVKNGRLFGKRVCKPIKVHRFYPKLKKMVFHFPKTKVSVKKSIGVPIKKKCNKVCVSKKQVKSLDKQLTRNFRKML